MSIVFQKEIPDLIFNNIKKYFSITKNKHGQHQIVFWEYSLKDILINTKMLDESECFISNDFKFKISGEPILVNNDMLAYTIKINIQNSADIEFIFKPYDIEIIVKDFIYWKSFYLYSKKQLHDNGTIYYDVEHDIIPYIIYGQYIYDMEGGSDYSLMELYQKGERNFKNLLLVNAMQNI